MYKLAYDSGYLEIMNKNDDMKTVNVGALWYILVTLAPFRQKKSWIRLMGEWIYTWFDKNEYRVSFLKLKTDIFQVLLSQTKQ